MNALLYSVPPTLQQATANLHLHWRFMDTHGQIWVSLLWSHCSFLLDPSVHKVLLMPSKSLFSQSYVSSGGSMVGLMATSSNRAYAIPKSAACRDPAPVAVRCWPIPPQETLKHSSVSVSVVSLGPGKVLIRFVWALSAFLASMGFDSKCDFTTSCRLGASVPLVVGHLLISAPAPHSYHSSRGKYQTQICRWQHPYGRKQIEIKELLDEDERGEREKAGLKPNIQKTNIMASRPITLWQIDGETMERLYFIGLQNHFRWWLWPWNWHLFLGRRTMTSLDSILKAEMLLCQQSFI